MAFFNKIKAVVQTEGARGIRQVLQKEGTKRFAQDLSAHLDVDSLSFCETRRYGLPALVSAIAVDPVQGLLASGTFKGAIAVTGVSELAGFLELEDAVSIKMIAFQPGAPVLIVIDAKNAITVFDLIKRQRLFVRNARNVVTCMELLSGSNWLFHGLKDGTIDVFDVYRGQAVPYRIPNIIPEGRKHSLVVSIKTHPSDNNQLLIAYNTGIALWNLKLMSVVRTFIYEIPPGAMGGVAVGDGMFGMNESRYPHVTVVSWKPDGLGFVSGYDDGCFVFWDIRQERPVLARTIHEINVNVPGIRPVFERDSAQFVPIYQLSWCLNENREDTTLIVAGGTSSIDMYGLHLFEYPAKADYRSPRRQHTLAMDSDILDFIVLPRESPWFNGTLDPVSILVLTNRGGVRSFSFDPCHIEQIVPATLCFVEPRLIIAKMYGQLSAELYNRLMNGHGGRKTSTAVSRIPLRGIKLAPIDESRICRDILVTAHADSSIRFWEGASLKPLHHLTVELGPLFFKNQGEIVAFEYSPQSEVLTIGFSNGNWIYGQLSQPGDLSRQSSIAKSVNEEYVDEALAANLRDAMDFRSEGLDPIPEQLPVPTALQGPVISLSGTPLPNKANATPHRSPHGSIEDTTQDQPPIPEHENTSQPADETLSSRPEGLEHLAPASPIDPATIHYIPPTGLHPIPPPLPDRAPSPSLPPRPAFVESALPNGSEFSPVFKYSSHLGRINQIAVSGCGLVAVSDEFYALSITDTRTGKVLHVEDLKVVTLDSEKVVNAQDTNNSHQDSRTDPSLEDPQTLQRVGVVIRTLQFVISTTSDQDKTPSLLLVAGSVDGIYIIFAISAPDDHPSQLEPLHPHQPQLRYVRKVETFQTKEHFGSVHTSVINVISPSESTALAATATLSNSSISSMSTTATSRAATSFSQQTQPYRGSHDSTNHPLPPPPPPHSPPGPALQRRSEDGGGYVPSLNATMSDTSSIGRKLSDTSNTSSSVTTKASLYSTWKETQEKVMSKAQQRLNYLVCVSDYGIRLHMNCTSRRIHKIDFSSQAGTASHEHVGKVGRIMAANVVYHGGACCILCVAESGRIWLFSVPKLEPIPLPVPGGELFLPIVLEPERLWETVILPDGRIFVPILKYEYRMYSLWGHDRWVQTPAGLVQERSAETSTYLQLYDHGIQIPPRPTNAGGHHASKGWFGLGQTVEESPSQEDLDELLGGEHYRAVNPILKRAGVQGPPGTTSTSGSPKTSNAESGSGGAGSGIASMMNQTLQNLDERGKRLGELGDKTAEMNIAGNDFLAAARELNAKNASKKWYEF